MLSSLVKLFVSGFVIVLISCASVSRVDATVFRDRASFNSASQNLSTVDFESGANIPDGLGFMEIDGLLFFNIGGVPSIVTTQNSNKLLEAPTIGEITLLTIFLPPGTTAVGCDQFATPMIVSTSSGESVTMSPSDTSTFVGFVSDQPIQRLIITFDFPEPTPNAFVDNLSFGQRRVGNEPPVPQLLMTNTGRAVALDSVAKTSEPFHVSSPHLLSTDGRTRITLFIVGLSLKPEDLPFVSAQAQDTQQRLVDLPVEAIGRAKNFTWMWQVTVRVPDTLAGAGELNIRVKVRDKESNAAPLRIE